MRCLVFFKEKKRFFYFYKKRVKSLVLRKEKWNSNSKDKDPTFVSYHIQLHCTNCNLTIQFPSYSTPWLRHSCPHPGPGCVLAILYTCCTPAVCYLQPSYIFATPWLFASKYSTSWLYPSHRTSCLYPGVAANDAPPAAAGNLRNSNT
jgi:hypothetical protein